MSGELTLSRSPLPIVVACESCGVLRRVKPDVRLANCTVCGGTRSDLVMGDRDDYEAFKQKPVAL
ncbi:MAG TPA: hypothetical protein VLI71_00235 [Gammaproteobacteria bacterium]|nr:hypothetical protein [Gammaproteobacteria bacterium]